MMLRSALAAVGVGLPLLLMAAPQPASAGIHQVWDEAHFLKEPTIEHVDDILDEIHTEFHKDLMIETFASIPDDLKPHLQREGKDKFYEHWSVIEGGDLAVNGVTVLITGEPPHLQVAVGMQTQEKAFTLADRDEMVKSLASAFREKDFDAGILQAAQFVRDRMARNLGTAAAPATQPATQPARAPASAAGGLPHPPP
ncbi:MAG: TPM domain-containing protein [Candidatus Saccharimonadales bacterium]